MRIVTVAISLAMMTALSACGSSDGAAEKDSSEGGSEVVQEVHDLLPDSATKSGVKLAIYDNGAPQEFVQDGKLVGLQPDLADALEDVMGVDLEVVKVSSFDTLIPGLQTGRYDVLFSGFAVSAERLESLDFISQTVTMETFATKLDSSVTIEGEEDLCGLSVSVLAATSYIPTLEKLSQKCTEGGNEAIDIKTYPTQPDAVLAVTTGRSDAFTTADDQLSYVVSQNSKSLVRQPFELGPAVMHGIFVVNDSDLAPAFQAGMQALIDSGAYQEILDKWDLESIALPGPVEVLADPGDLGS